MRKWIEELTAWASTPQSRDNKSALTSSTRVLPYVNDSQRHLNKYKLTVELRFLGKNQYNICIPQTMSMSHYTFQIQ